MKRMKEKTNLFLVIVLLCCLSLGAVAEEAVLTIQALKRANAFSEDTVLQEDLDLKRDLSRGLFAKKQSLSINRK